MPARQLDRLVRLFSVLVPTAVAGCADRGIDEQQFTERLCDDNGYTILEGIRPAEPIDYVELRDFTLWGGEEETPPARVLDAAGEICGTASDPGACMVAFEALPPESELSRGGFDGTFYRSVALTRGDEASAITSAAGLREFLGPIDSLSDAGLLAVGQFHGLICDGRDNAVEVEDGYLLFTRSGGGCGEGDDIEEHVVHVGSDGTIEVIQSEIVEKTDPNCAVGRLPAGLCRRARRAAPSSAVGRFFTEVAELEAAAVTAFAQLGDELAVHGAPGSLRGWAARSRRDEIRHARQTAALARRHGGRPVMPRVSRWQPRSLTEVAVDNATEGCIRETYGALVAHVQARRAQDPAVRRVLRRIAADETRHAALSWELHLWVQQRLSPSQRGVVKRRTGEALERLQHELTTEQAEAVHRVAGMPRPDQARVLFAGLRRQLFA